MFYDADGKWRKPTDGEMQQIWRECREVSLTKEQRAAQLDAALDKALDAMASMANVKPVCIEPYKAPESGDDYIRMLTGIGKLPPAIFEYVEGIGPEIYVEHGDWNWSVTRRGHDWHVEAVDDSHDFLTPMQAIDFIRDEIRSLLRSEKTVTAEVFAADLNARGIKDATVNGNQVRITHQGRKLVAKQVAPKRKSHWDVMENGVSILPKGPMPWHWAAHEIEHVGVVRKPFPQLPSVPGIDAVVSDWQAKRREPKICRLSDFPSAVANTLVPPTAAAPVATVAPVAVRWRASPFSLDFTKRVRAATLEATICAAVARLEAL
jgi:hypothetical protein